MGQPARFAFGISRARAPAPHWRCNKNPLDDPRGFANWLEKIYAARNYVARLEALRAFEQVELDSLAFVQRAVAVLLDGGEMHEDILAGGALDEPRIPSPR